MSERDDTARLISALLDEQIDEAERVRLELLIETDAAARRLYFQMIDQEIELSCLVVPAGDARVVPVEFKRAAPVERRWHRLALVAALLLLAAIVAAVAPRIFERKKVASLVASDPDATMNEDFERGVNAGWQGAIVSAGLPAGSKFGIAPVAVDHPYGRVHTIQSPENWHDGLFALTDRSTLHVTFRWRKIGHVNVFVHTLDPRAPGGFAMFQLRKTVFPKGSTEWQTAAIPFSEFIRKIPATPGGPPEFIGGPPLAGERVAVLSFSNPGELDLVIDRVWVTPAGK